MKEMVNENGELVDESRNILEEIAECVRERIAKKKELVPLALIQEQAMSLLVGTFPLEEALKQDGMSFICEIKKASPSKGLIAPDFPYKTIAKEYEQAGASAISCLTEPTYFMGENVYLAEIAKEVTIPILRKDFFVDEYMIYEAKVLGASAILLICAILSEEEMIRFAKIADELGMSTIFEAHDEEEVASAVRCGARIIGVNNRNLKTFELDLNTSIHLREQVGRDILFLSESGIRTRADVAMLEEHHVDGVLIGETLMRSPNKRAVLEELKGLG